MKKKKYKLSILKMRGAIITYPLDIKKIGEYMNNFQPTILNN